MRKSTLEEATLELGKHTEVADFHVQYNPPGIVYVYDLFIKKVRVTRYSFFSV